MDLPTLLAQLLVETYKLFGECLIELLKALLLIIAGFVAFHLVSGRWEKEKVKIDYSSRLGDRYWVRLEVLGRYLGDKLSSQLQSAGVKEKQEVFFRLLDFRLTLYRFYEEVAGIFVGRERQELSRLTSTLEAELCRIMPRYKWSQGIAAIERTPSGTQHLSKAIDDMDTKANLLRALFAIFDKWLSSSQGSDADNLAARFRAYAIRMERYNSSMLSYLSW
jgi:hypothetical protein